MFSSTLRMSLPHKPWALATMSLSMETTLALWKAGGSTDTTTKPSMEFFGGSMTSCTIYPTVSTLSLPMSQVSLIQQMTHPGVYSDPLWRYLLGWPANTLIHNVCQTLSISNAFLPSPHLWHFGPVWRSLHLSYLCPVQSCLTPLVHI